MSTPSKIDERQLFSVAYGVLGTVADAQDVVQDAQVKLLQAAESPAEPGAWLFRVVTNLAIDKLRHEQVRRQEYVGPWLPEPVLAEELVELSEDLSMGLLLILENLSPVERAIYVLRQAFDLSFAEIGAITEASEASTRQRFHRAQKKVDAAERIPTVPADQQELINQLLLAIAGGDRRAVMSLLNQDAVFYSDGGGVVGAALIPVTGPERIAQMALFFAGKYPMNEGRIRFVELPGGVGMLTEFPQEPPSLTVLEGSVVPGEVQLHRGYIQRNPHKMGAFLRRVNSKD